MKERIEKLKWKKDEKGGEYDSKNNTKNEPFNNTYSTMKKKGDVLNDKNLSSPNKNKHNQFHDKRKEEGDLKTT